ncbi:MAG: type II toxin-antitoxin system death-on-curing family toxin [Sedimentisphaerales bacterium]|nr:type II toxin-antitoxin system death-on-curing family toxin [Sedimentisphaerales bacterium]
MIKEISIQDIEHIAFELARQHLSFDEPIPDYTTRFPNILESCVAMPFMRIGGKYLYKNLIDQASVLMYLMVKNHPFQNGNKRIAVSTLLYFLLNNKKWLKTDARDLYNFTVWLAQSPSVLKDETIAAIQRYIDNYIVTL